MSINIFGWVEVKTSIGKQPCDWKGLMRIDDFIASPDEDSDYLFDISRNGTPETSEGGGLGLPKDISKEAKLDVDSLKEFEKLESNFSFDEVFGFSYVSYDRLTEIKAKDQLSGQQWIPLFDIMEILAIKKYGSKNVRLVVWALW